MKPSERRAMQAEKHAQREAEARERELEGMARNKEDGIPKNDEATNSAPDAQGERAQNSNSTPYKRKEGFVQSHVRLITFIITSLVVLFVLGPLGVDMLVAKRNQATVQNKEDITIEMVCRIYDSYKSIDWDSFDDYNYDDHSDRKEGYLIIEREYPVKDTALVVKAGGSSRYQKPEYIYLIDYKTGNIVNLAKEDPREYIKSHKEN